MNNIQRQKEIFSLIKKGKTQVEIGKIYKVSRQRIQQIINETYFIPREEICLFCKKTFIKIHPLNKFCNSCSPQRLALEGRERTREMVRIRDNHTCQSCGLVWNKDYMRRFDIHHLNGECGKLSRSYDKIENIDNLITLCHRCHMNLDGVKEKVSKKISPRKNKIIENHNASIKRLARRNKKNDEYIEMLKK